MDPSGHFAFALPWIPSITAGVIEGLLEIGKAVIVGGVAWILGSEIGKIKKDNKKIYYYDAMIHTDGQVYFGDKLTKAQAAWHLKHKSNVMATTAKKAKSACKEASPIGVAQYDSVHKKACGYRKHYHPVKNRKKNKDGKYKNRIKAHCFY